MSNGPSAAHPERERESDASLGRGRAFRLLFGYARPHRKTFLLILLCAVGAISADLLQPYLVKVAIDNDILLGDKGTGWLIGICAAYLVSAVAAMLLAYGMANLIQRAGQAIVASLRKDLFEHITKLSMSFFDRYPIGSLVTHESSDTETINQFFTQVFLSLIRDGLTLVLILGFMFALDVELALYSLVLLPVIAAIAFAFRTLLRNSYHRTRTQLSRMIAYLAENLSGMSLIQAFHQEKEQKKRFTRHNEKYWMESLREIRNSVTFNRTFDLLGNVAVAFIVWIGGMAVLNKQLEFGVLYAFISYIRQFFQPINQLTQQWNTMQSTLVSLDRLWRIFSVKPEVADPSEDRAVRVDPERVAGKLTFAGVRFAYGDGPEVLRGIDLDIRPGEFVGIVGTTGAGKSSLVNLLPRFYDVKAGSLLIDDIDVRSLPLRDLHAIVGLVQQEPYLFSGSIIDNVRLFRREIPEEAVVEACRTVGAHPMIARLRDGYDTVLSERGSGLSAGERQLISFARILVFRPRILILDEATAHLDSHTERLIQRALETVSRGRTTLVIAHRLSTVRHADRIIVMRDGQIVEQGKHADLIKNGGYYAELCRHSGTGHATAPGADGRLRPTSPA
ncbi:ABC transporter ATP-binding protein [Paenibacillus thermoaerophilus]|uniref:ABC transporter ATP-binding protein n=1 Tax=Paenibacillus thermoaerophilus TaxID=1215385 RepID=A0ABW2V4B9_9BACL|nr:ABC transporter ATP-binding protein [Paenibacillus thermoaerophilus]